MIDFGWWAGRDGRRALLSWWRDGGRLVLDGPAGVQTIAVIPDEDEVRRRLEGWEAHADQANGLAWLATALDGAR